jgi:hypothetical protein
MVPPLHGLVVPVDSAAGNLPPIPPLNARFRALVIQALARACECEKAA